MEIYWIEVIFLFFFFDKSIKIKNLKTRVEAENEQYFNDAFWESLSFVVNAVDNNKSRLFVSNQCVWFEKPLFDSGTDGTKCHS